MKKNPLNTSLRSEIHATDSTRNGCSENSAATIALRQNAFVIEFSSSSSKTELAQWNRTFSMCIAPGFKPNNWQSAMCESHVSGCQLQACWSASAHTKFGQLNPARTTGLLKT